jgi:hypothetical protein
MKTHAVIYGDGAQALKTVPMGLDGEPLLLSAATARIVDLRHSENATDYTIEAEAAATVDSGTTDTTTANVGRGYSEKKEIPVSTPANFDEGSVYALVASSGEVELITVERTSSGSVFAVNDIRKSFASGSTLRGVEVSFTFPAATADSETEFDDHADVPYAIDWYWTGATPSHARELIYVRRGPEKVYANPEDVQTLDFTVGRLNSRDNKLELSLVQSHRDFRRIIKARRIDPDTANFGDAGRDWVAYRAAEILRRGMGGDEHNAILADQYRQEHEAILNDLGGFGETYTDKGTDRAVVDIEQRIQAWRRT